MKCLDDRVFRLYTHFGDTTCCIRPQILSSSLFYESSKCHKRPTLIRFIIPPPPHHNPFQRASKCDKRVTLFDLYLCIAIMIFIIVIFHQSNK